MRIIGKKWFSSDSDKSTKKIRAICLERVRQTARIFWEKAGGHNTLAYRSLSKDYRLKLLIEMSNIIIRKVSDIEVRKTRMYFDKHKFNENYRIKECFVCLGSGEIRHHIIQLQNGGENIRINIVGLCKKCHAEIHPWMQTLYRDNGRGGYDPVIR